ncbi:MAG: hypothetical protein V1685_02490, partial [Parcubacteria group bacterium]
MNHQRLIVTAVCLIIILVWIGFLHANPSYLVDSLSPVRLVRDTHETENVYYSRSAPLAAGEMPYTTTPQEYPILSVLYISMPRFFTDYPETFATILSATNAAMLICVVVVSSRLLSILGVSYHRLWLLVFPATLYFTFNRFD